MKINYKSFLRVTEDGHIWQVLKDALQLGAEYRPILDTRTMTTSLLASVDEVLAQMNERTLLGAFNDARLTLDKPITFEPDGLRYVNAEGFLI